ncbi:Shikimate dehydrogenase [Desulfonema limicola]|uniref:Shikimate dehydrogenase (NADP(+)) n=1 Tax=Desulfonema limicola TaxID=45656 RepID=A0A975BAB5_9BACT|nr:shikimate dehydrogenase [Desulfonema limicola]QTA81485.1 Shikimate dehydrogenase [Desulfonema limicola]
MNIDSKTNLYCVFGNPVSHSLSPVMHNSAFCHAGLNNVYLAFKINDIQAGIMAARAFNVQGISVTIPHKISIMPFLDEIDPGARRIGAVNTVVNKNGKLLGFNSDSLGAVAALEEKTDLAGKKTAILGAGGAARAIGFGVQEKGGHVSIINRSADKGRKLAHDLNAGFCPLSDFNSAGYDILINTTPLGMTPDIESMPVKPDTLKPGMTVMDIIYNPLETKLLKHAAAAGCKTIDGLSMFVYQGALQFELWTGEKAPVDIMKKTVKQALGIKI